jgi:hypothetical protein
MTAARIADAIGTTERPAFSALRVLVGGGAVIQVADRYVDAVTLEAAVGAARAQLLNGPANLRDLCELWGVGRERAVPIAEYMDSEGLSERRGNTRIAGPRGFASDS